MGLIKNTLRKIFEGFDPPITPEVLAPCPDCGADVSRNHKKAHGGKDDLIFFQCFCGHASAWYWDGHGAQLIYGDIPDENVNEE